MKTTDAPILVQEIFDIPVEKVWSAITDHKEMIQWYFEDIPDFSSEVGFMTRFAVNSSDRTFTHQWEVIDVIPNQRITYNWNYAEYPGDGDVTFELIKNDHGVLLRLSMTIKDDFPDDIPEFKRESCEAGWNYFIKERLKQYLLT